MPSAEVPAGAPAVTVRRLGVNEAAACVPALAEVLIDCVAGGASVSFMHPLAHDRAVAFWRGVAEGVARGERALLIAEAVGSGAVLGTVQARAGAARGTSRTGPTWPRCWCTAALAARAWPGSCWTPWTPSPGRRARP